MIFCRVFRILTATFLVCATAAPATASLSAPRPVHPIGWMHQLPGGEAPGWTSDAWTDVEFSWANVWNTPVTLLNTQNGQTLTYEADFEQKTTYFEKGFALTDWLAFAVEFAYADRSGGVFDTYIDDFHKAISSDRFQRHLYPRNRSYFQTTSNGNESLIANSASGLSNTKFKLKIWPARWTETNPNCPCGIGFSLQLKVPVGDPRRGLTSGSVDATGLVHVGIPLGADSAFFVTAGATALGDNKALEHWPRKRSILTLDGSADLNISGGFGLLLNFQVGSPLVDLTPLTIVDPAASDPRYKEKRLSSGWNSLVLWRVYESIGFRYRFESGARMNISFTEDIGINDYDEVDDYVYVNGAPDFMVSAGLMIPF